MIQNNMIETLSSGVVGSTFSMIFCNMLILYIVSNKLGISGAFFCVGFLS